MFLPPPNFSIISLNKFGQYLLSFVIITSVAYSLSVQAQGTAKAKSYKGTDKYTEADSSTNTNANYQIRFKNVGLIPFYYDEKKIRQIKLAEKANDHRNIRPLLEDYVQNFGIENFSRNDDLLWKLAQIYEGAGEIENAKWIYSLILKSTHKNVEYVRNYYNALTQNDQDYYVPIDYYYELVEYRKKIDTLRPPRGTFLNMGSNINSRHEDYGPTLNVDNDILMFTSKRNRKKVGETVVVNEDVYFAEMIDGKWGKAEAFEGINSEFNEGSPCLSKDREKLYFIRCKAPDGIGNCDIYEAESFGDGEWGKVKNLGTNINSKEWDSHPSLSHTGDTLFFSSNRGGGFGEADIYLSVKNHKGKWQKARNIGPSINTKGSELSPFFHPKYPILYFSSTGHSLNFGNFDIYKSHFENHVWSEPKNIGPLVNGEGDEYYFTIDSEAKDLFYARSESNRMTNLDLYSFPLPMEAQPMATTVFKGTLKDSVTGKHFKGIVSILDLENGIEVAPKFIRPDGSFEFDLINENKYLLVIQGEEFFRIEKSIDLNGDTSIRFATPSVNFLRLQFESIEFASGSADILDEMKTDLDKLMNFILDNPTMHLVISGHTDSQGNFDLNYRLSQWRADAIRAYLIVKGGVDETRIEAIGYGSEKPIIKNEKSDQDRRINRRVEFEIFKVEEELKMRSW